MNLTQASVKSAKISHKGYKLTDSNGLYLFVHPNGSKYWRFNYKFGKQKTLSYGVYPDVSLAQARDKHRDAKKLLADGVDPSQNKIVSRVTAQENVCDTFRDLAQEWWEFKTAGPDWTPRTSEDVRKILEYNVYSEIGSFPVKDLTPQILLACLRKIEKRKVLDTSNRCQAHISNIFRYGIITGRAESNPAAELRLVMLPNKQESFAALPIDRLKEFWQILEQNRMRSYPQSLLALKVLIYMYPRTRELIHAKWEDIDLKKKVWNIPAEYMKVKRDFIIPLSTQSCAIFKELNELSGGNQWCFPSIVRSSKPMNETTVLRLIQKMGFQHIATGHGFRGMASTNQYEKEMAAGDIIEKQLSHEVGSKVKRAYNKAQYMKQRFKLMQDWADYIDSVVATGKI